MAFIDKMSITEFKGRVREEARCLNTCGLTQALGVERDPDTVQANVAKHIFPHESKIITNTHAVTVDTEITQSRNVTNESPKSTLQSRLEKHKTPRAVAADVAEGDIEAAEAADMVEIAEISQILPTSTLIPMKAQLPPIIQFSAA
jgi:hypothetical protein